MRALLAVVVMLVLGVLSDDVRAQGCSDNTCSYASEGEAFSGCVSMAQAAAGVVLGNGMTFRNPRCIKPGTSQSRFRCQIDRYNANGTVNTPDAGCNLANLFEWHAYPPDKQCSAQAPLLNVSFQGNLASCYTGCEYAAGIGEPGDTVTVIGSGAAAVTRVSRMSPTGQTCTVGAEYQEVQTQTTDHCQQQGNLTQCITTDGRTCTVGRSGKRYCWEPTEAGIKLSGNEAGVKAPEGTAIKQPPKAPSNGGDWQQGGTGTVSVTTGGVTNNYNTTNYNSSYGNQGSGANGGGADGEGNGGSGEGEGEGNGSAGGGATCTQPYVCSGDPIMCSLGQQMWLSRCGDRKGDANGDGVPDVLVGDAPENPDPGEDVNPTRWGINIGTELLDTENIFGAGSCPMMPSFSIMGVTVAPSEFPQWCTLVAVMRAVVLLMGAFIAISLLMGGS